MHGIIMRSLRVLFRILASTTALSVLACGSSDSGSKPAPVDNGECTAIGLKCPTSNDFDEALCHNADDTQLWYRICADAACTTGTDFLCNGTDCSDAAQPARDACLVRNPN